MGARGISKRAPIGKRFGRLVVRSKTRPSPGNSTLVGVICDCGTELDVFVSNLMSQEEPMCPACRKLSRPSKGMHKHPLFTIWKGIVQRCENPKHTFYRLYGGRGIKLCPKWRNDFLAFTSDIGERPSMSHTIDRIEVDGDYKPGNVRWATHREQGNNRKEHHFIEWKGVSMTLAEAAELSAVDYQTLRYRIAKNWDIDTAMTLPSTMTTNKGKPRHRRYTD